MVSHRGGRTLHWLWAVCHLLRAGVYAFDYDTNKPVVANPNQCMTGCSTCGTICSQDALEFPSPGFIRHLIKEKKILRQTKTAIRENREKYDIKQH